jgi:hypothetical protein
MAETQPHEGLLTKLEKRTNKTDRAWNGMHMSRGITRASALVQRVKDNQKILNRQQSSHPQREYCVYLFCINVLLPTTVNFTIFPHVNQEVNLLPATSGRHKAP